MLDAFFLSVWPIHLHFLFFTDISIGVCLVLLRSCSLEMCSGHLILRMVGAGFVVIEAAG